MALNKKMHPRNPYKTPPSFKDLALKNEEFRKNAKIEISGKVSIDFKNAESLRALTRALLKEDWGLDIVLPPEYLVPTLPLRLNYILWLEDLVSALKIIDSGSPIYGIDIGTGASCIYPLLAAKKNGWHMLGVEKDEKCFKHAQENVERNNLESLIKIRKNDGESIIVPSILNDVFGPEPNVFHFTMCNPPFYASEEELEKTSKSRSTNHPRPPPHNARTGSPHEVVVDGGEVAFIFKMIDESFEVRDKIQIFSTMLGHKSSFSKILKYLKEKDIQEIASTEFCQGHVTRWGLAWSHTVKLTCESFTVENVGPKQKPKPPLRYIIPNGENNSIRTFDSLLHEVKSLLDQLNMEYKCVIKDVKSVGFQVTAYSKTWSNQRRKRRDKIRNTSESGKEETVLSDAVNIKEEGAESKPSCRDDGKESDEPPSKKLRLSEEGPLVVMGLIFREDEAEGYILEMNWLHGRGGKDSVHQILQYFKNNMK